jgi:hypothetical protein
LDGLLFIITLRVGDQKNGKMWYDTLIAIVIILVIILIAISRITKQTIPEFIGQMIDLIREKKEDAFEHIEVYE